MNMHVSVSHIHAHTHTHGVRGIHIFLSASVLATGVISVSKQTFLFYIYREGCMNHSANAGVRRQLLGVHSLLLGMEFRGSGLAVSIFMLRHLTDA